MGIYRLQIVIFLKIAYFLKIILGGYLGPEDFFNARFVDNSFYSNPPLNDQRISLKRFPRGSGVVSDTDKWPSGRIPYVLSDEYKISSAKQQRAVIARAMMAYAERTCIRFVPKQDFDMDYLTISKIDGCYADFARIGGPQQVSLADECVQYPTVIHELMHVVGFIHEHQREDRDSYVKIVWENILPGADTDFRKLPSIGLSYYGEPYDYFSIMHYEATEGSRNGRNTIEAKQPTFTYTMGKSRDFSISDLNRINRAYQCFSF